MLTNTILKLALAALCFISVFASNITEEETEFSDLFAYSTTTTIYQLYQSRAQAPLPRPTGPCWVSQVKAAKLMHQMATWIRTLNDDADIQQLRAAEVQIESANEKTRRTECSDYRMEMLTDDLAEFGRRLWKLSTTLVDPNEAEIDALNMEKSILIDHLRELQVFAGPVLSSSSLVLHSFAIHLDFLESGFNNALGLFNPLRPARQFRLFADQDTNGILDPGNTLDDLVSLAQKHPTAMSTTLPHLVASKYSGNPDNFRDTIWFISNLTSIDHKIIGYSTLYEELRRHSHLETSLLTELAAHVKPVKTKVSQGVTLSCSSRTLFNNLIVAIGPIINFVNAKATCIVTNFQFRNTLMTYDRNWPEQAVLYSSSDSYEKQTFVHQKGTGLFYIRYDSHYIYATEPHVRDSKKRRVLEDSLDDIPDGAFMDWKLIPIQGTNDFRILNARYDEVLFADWYEMLNYYPTYRHVFLRRTDSAFQQDDILKRNTDRWTLSCSFKS